MEADLDLGTDARYSEIGVKKKVWNFIEKLLTKTIEEAIRGLKKWDELVSDGADVYYEDGEYDGADMMMAFERGYDEAIEYVTESLSQLTEKEEDE